MESVSHNVTHIRLDVDIEVSFGLYQNSDNIRVTIPTGYV